MRPLAAYCDVLDTDPGLLELLTDLGVIMQMDRLLYSRKAAAEALSISIRSLDYLLSEKKFRTRRIGRKVLIPRAELVKFAQSSTSKRRIRYNLGPMGKDRGIFERPKGSGIFWINYYVNGKQHREKVGAKGNAIKLYRKRKEDDRAGRKLPELRNTKTVTLSELIDDTLEFVAHHKDLRNYQSRGEIVRGALGSRPASEITPKELLAWLNKHTKTAATFNRYKALIGLCFRVAEDNGKIDSNPARKFRPRKEDNARIRFLSRDEDDDEYGRLCGEIASKFPEHLAEFVVSVHTGMRLTEQYTTEWNQVHSKRKTIELNKTKNGQKRTVNLNADALAAIESLRRPEQRPTDPVFPRDTDKNFDNPSWLEPCLEAAGVTGYTWHCNRHTFGSWLAMAGASTKEIQEAGGWKTIQMAARYSHLSPSHKQSVVERIASKEQHAPLHAPASKKATFTVA
jgi:integrase